jgi:hypothetical protein
VQRASQPTLHLFLQLVVVVVSSCCVLCTQVVCYWCCVLCGCRIIAHSLCMHYAMACMSMLLLLLIYMHMLNIELCHTTSSIYNNAWRLVQVQTIIHTRILYPRLASRCGRTARGRRTHDTARARAPLPGGAWQGAPGGLPTRPGCVHSARE